jgi:hypothetical protein
MKTKVTASMNEALTKEFSDAEIEKALFQIGPLKAPGPDGFHARFFQRNWKILKKEVISAIKHFFSEDVLPQAQMTLLLRLSLRAIMWRTSKISGQYLYAMSCIRLSLSA